MDGDAVLLLFSSLLFSSLLFSSLLFSSLLSFFGVMSLCGIAVCRVKRSQANSRSMDGEPHGILMQR